MGELDMFDDGKHHDGEAGDKIFGNVFSVKGAVAPGVKLIGIVAEDDKGNFSSVAATLEITSQADAMMIWDGEKFAHGQSWIAPQSALNSFKAQTEESHSPKVLEISKTEAGVVNSYLALRSPSMM